MGARGPRRCPPSRCACGSPRPPRAGTRHRARSSSPCPRACPNARRRADRRDGARPPPLGRRPETALGVALSPGERGAGHGAGGLVGLERADDRAQRHRLGAPSRAAAQRARLAAVAVVRRRRPRGSGARVRRAVPQGDGGSGSSGGRDRRAARASRGPRAGARSGRRVRRGRGRRRSGRWPPARRRPGGRRAGGRPASPASWSMTSALPPAPGRVISARSRPVSSRLPLSSAARPSSGPLEAPCVRSGWEGEGIRVALMAVPWSIR